MSIQNILWTAIPNGFNSAQDKLVLSVLVTPRLVTNNRVDGELSEFGEFIDWPLFVNSLRFNVEIQNGPSFTINQISNPQLESVLWREMFGHTTYVRSYEFQDDDFSNRIVWSYPIREVVDSIKDLYKNVAVNSPDKKPQSYQLGESNGHTIFNLNRIVFNLQEEEIVKREIQQNISANKCITSEFLHNNTLNAPRESIYYYLVEQDHRYLSQKNPDGTPVPLQTQHLPRIDFHQIVGRLSQYPELMRRMAITIDLEIPINIPPTGNIRVTPINFPSSVPMTPWTSYQLDIPNGRFLPSSDSNSEVLDGMLQLNADNYNVVEFDVDGAASKVMQFAKNIIRVNNNFTSTEKQIAPPSGYGLPSLRSSGFSISRVDRAKNLVDRLQNTHAINHELETNPSDPGVVLKADDLIRGYRIDVWDSSSQNWHSLCFRDGTYHFHNSDIIRRFPDEGFISMVTTQSADGTSPDLHLPEELFCWNGWGLCIRRIGKTIGPSNQAEDSQNPSNTEFQLETSFKAVSGPTPRFLLPKLRFGTKYQFRARAVNLIGNSLSLDANIDSTFSIPAEPFSYLRFEPVSAPVLLLREALDANFSFGETINRIVIRSNYNSSSIRSSERHVASPQTSQHLSELHGMFDTPSGMDRTIYNTLVNKEGSFEIDPQDPNNQIPHPEAKVDLPYLPDPIAVGVALYNLPGVNAESKVYKTPFSGSWPDKQSFRIELVEGSGPPIFTETFTERVLTVKLPKAEVVEVELSCYINENDLENMAIRQWIKEVNPLPPNIDDIKQLTLDGRFWMITPPRIINLVHAVQQPLIEPKFQKLTAARNLGDTTVNLTDEIPIDGKSTIKLDINSTWQEPIDDGIVNNPTNNLQHFSAHAFQLPISRDITIAIINHKQEFHDTKYHKVTYTAVATSSFKEYFTNDPNSTLDFTRKSYPITIDILNSKRPLPPKVLYVIPTFNWERDTEGAWKVSRRSGGGLRIYLDRPWYLSGDGELLGVVIWSDAPPPNTGKVEIPELIKPYVTQWGMDPIWVSNPAPTQSMPLLSYFEKAVKMETELSLEEISNLNDPLSSNSVSVAGHKVEYDKDGRLFCDIKIDPAVAYFPFIRLALVRYQPKSLTNTHLSTVVLADFSQLMPNRSASITFDAFDPTLLQIAITGLTYNGPGQAIMQVTVEVHTNGTNNQNTWIPLSSLSSIQLTPHREDTGKTTLWMTSITLPFARSSRQMRLLIQEFEVFDTGRFISFSGSFRKPIKQKRLIYADVILL